MNQNPATDLAFRPADGIDDPTARTRRDDRRDGREMRDAQRHTLLIRAAKLQTANGEFVCVVRDISKSGVSARFFHAPPPGEEAELHMPGGGRYPLRAVWRRAHEAGYAFAGETDIAPLVCEVGEHPKRGLRLAVCFPVRLRTRGTDGEVCSDAIVENLSQQGARIACDAMFAIDQAVQLERAPGSAGFAATRARIRWRGEGQYGAVFDDTLSLADFARLAARVQSPRLLD